MSAHWTSRASIPGHQIDCTQGSERDDHVAIAVECSCGYRWASSGDAATTVIRFADTIDAHLRTVAV